MAEGFTAFRRASGGWGVVQRVVLCALPVVGGLYLLDLHLLVGFVFLRQQYLALLLMLTLAGVFLSIPGSRGAAREQVPWYDVVGALAGVVVGVYLMLLYP
ncbi:MAG: hypothetical protein Q8S13_00530, partial [Dehalococcoidia bacterium]|nr:hypothetical protein [Dehalococcoidia bacterium]